MFSNAILYFTPNGISYVSIRVHILNTHSCKANAFNGHFLTILSKLNRFVNF